MKKKNIKIAILLLAVAAAAIMIMITKNTKIIEQNDYSLITHYSNTTDQAVQSYVQDQKDWKLILVNSNNPIPSDYEFYLLQLSNGIYVDSRIYPDLQQMFDAARNDGIYPTVSEGYRTHEEQQRMMDDKINNFVAQGYSKREAKKLAKEWVAEPGKSEHELGLALDINADENGFSSDWDVYDWLAENAYKYGFILRYPQDKEYITGIDHEPWHYRYVGKEAALEIYTQQITLEEYLE